MTGCCDRDIPFTNENDYLRLKGHYAIDHYRAWFVKREDARPRTQKVTEPGKGTICTLCRERIYGNDEVMIQHYSAKHELLAAAVLDGSDKVNDEDGRKILVDLFPDQVDDYDYRIEKKNDSD